jgi:hypothetical protein
MCRAKRQENNSEIRNEASELPSCRAGDQQHVYDRGGEGCRWMMVIGVDGICWVRDGNWKVI